ncbi:NAD(P)/FAD-dependent oxidoreductase [Pseudarthrobacter sp. fls2-241-R2A-168]|uniref:flavin-containing monooxygenase n=1 Tax=Pseudarthrobacter sp. fls2-241-R2A-168 TaxID=3040304 RepID=UPI00255456AF|nr:NAD(P)/FAD-dependent oxidoreductase [Pseudarthrobacter sp. fls2-241-R2A-168]
MRVETAIVGAGFAGIAAAISLGRAGRGSFIILERGASVGGTWRDNTYPGVACDVPSHLYGLESHPNPAWSSAFASGSEIHGYLEAVVRDEDLTGRILLNTAMTGAQWNGRTWRIAAGDRQIVADHLILACGRLTEPRVPTVPGLGTFPGPMFHSARWDHSVEVDGTRVAVVGSGASAVQLAPALSQLGAKVTLFQRSAAWILPKGDRPYTPEEQSHWRSYPAELARVRDELYRDGEARFASRAGDRVAATAARKLALRHLYSQVDDRGLRRVLTPDYAFGCKRVLLSDAFYPSIASGEIQLEASALAAVEGNTLTAASGTRSEVDVLILATGFETTRQPYARLIENENGLTLDQHWSTGMTSVGSIFVAGFPSLFVLNGPNASLGHNSSILMIEAQTDFTARLIAAEPGPVRVSADAETAYTREIVTRSANTAWIAGGCRNWYTDGRSGRLTLLWPGTVEAYRGRLEQVLAANIETNHQEPALLSKGTS